jgi:hypothetical protein
MTHHERDTLAIKHIVHDWGMLIAVFTTSERKPYPLNHSIERAFLVECRKFANFFRNKSGPKRRDMIANTFTRQRFEPELPVWT